MAVTFRVGDTFAVTNTTIDVSADPSTDDILIVPLAESDTAGGGPLNSAWATIGTGYGGTWVQEHNQLWGSRRRLNVWVNDDFTTVAGTATVTYVSNQDQAGGCLVVEGATKGAAYEDAQAGASSGTNWTPTLTAGSSGDGHVVVIQMEDTVTISTPSGWTKHAQVTASGGLRSLAVYSAVGTLSDTTPTFSWSGTNGYTAWAGYFPAAASGTTGTGAPTMARHTGAGSGSTTSPGTTGSSATTLVRHTAAGSGSTTVPPTSGSGAPALARHSAAGAGSASIVWYDVTSDDFESYADADNWLPAGWSESASNWKIFDDSGNNVLYPPNTQTVTTYDVGTSNQASQATVKSASGLLGGVVVRVADINNLLLLELVRFGSENAIKLYRRITSTWTEMDAVASFGFSDGMFYELRIEIIGLDVTGFVDGVAVVSGTLTAPQEAALGTRAGMFGEAIQPNFDNMLLQTDTPATATGSSATTLVRHTAAGSGSTGVTGTSAASLVRHTGSGSGSTTGIVGTSATTLARHTAAGSGSTTGPVVGTSATTLVRATAAGSGTSTPPGGTGVGSPTLARHTAAGSGSTVAPSTTGSGSPTCTRHTAAGVGSTGLSGTAGVTLIRHTLTGSGTSTPPGGTGTGSPTLARHTAAGTGTSVAPAVTGTGTLLLARHTAVGVSSGVTVTGRLTTADNSVARTTDDTNDARTTTEAFQ